MAKTKSKNSAIKKFGKTEYSNDKEYLNAIVSSDTTYKVGKKSKARRFKISLWTYAIVVFTLTLLSLAMLALPSSFEKNNKTIISIIEMVVFAVLSIDLALRWYTSEVRMKKGNWSYFLFPITITGLMLIASLLPSLYLINVWMNTHNEGLEVLKNMKFLRIFRIILLANLIPGISIFTRVLSKEKRILLIVFTLVMITILLFSLVIYNIEEGKSGTMISSFWDALYFSTITLTTIGFGDVTPVQDMGKVVTIVMSIIGIAVLAIPSGIIAGGFIAEIKATRKKDGSKKK